jgi:pimeloyl-ACP methyl ester carboxylesterase
MKTVSHPQISRRGMLAATAGAALANAHPTAQAKGRHAPNNTYVLVHSAWHGGWCWKKLTALLRARGHVVLAPTLTGLGERAHLASRDVGLETHIKDVVNVLDFENLSNVNLVGHSSSGAVITGVADRVPQRLAQVVYLDAFVPENGQTLMDLIPTERREGMEQRVKIEGEGWLLPSLAPMPWDEFLLKAWKITDESDRRWMLARLAPTPFKVFKDPVRCPNFESTSLARTFIRCLHWPNDTFDRHLAHARSALGWQHYELATSHEPFITHPGQLAEVLLRAAT